MNKIYLLLLGICIPFLLQAQCEADAGTIVLSTDNTYCENETISYIIEDFNESEEYTQIYARGYFCDLFTADYFGLEPEESFVAPDFSGTSNDYVIIALNVLTSELPEEIDESIIIEAEFNLTCYDFVSKQFLLEDCNPLEDANAGELDLEEVYCIGQPISVEATGYNNDGAYSQIYNVQKLNSGNDIPISNNQFIPENPGTYVISAANFPTEYHPNNDECVLIPIFTFDDILSTAVYYDLVTDTITVLNPIEVSASYIPSDATLVISIEGGMPEYANENGGDPADYFYTIAGDISGDFQFGDNIYLEVAPNDSINLTIIDNMGCSAITEFHIPQIDGPFTGIEGNCDENVMPYAGEFTGIQNTYCQEDIINLSTINYNDDPMFSQLYFFAPIECDVFRTRGIYTESASFSVSEDYPNFADVYYYTLIAVNILTEEMPTPEVLENWANGATVLVQYLPFFNDAFSCYDINVAYINIQDCDPLLNSDAGEFPELQELYCEDEIIDVSTMGYNDSIGYQQTYYVSYTDGEFVASSEDGLFDLNPGTYIFYALNKVIEGNDDCFSLIDLANLENYFQEFMVNYDYISTNTISVLPASDPYCSCNPNAGTFASTIEPAYCQNDNITVQAVDFAETGILQYVATTEDLNIVSISITGEFTLSPNTYTIHAVNIFENGFSSQDIGQNLNDVLNNFACYDIISTESFEIFASNSAFCNCTPNAGNFINMVGNSYCEDNLITFETSGFYEENNFVQQYVLTDENGEIVSINNTGEFTPTPNTYIGYAINVGDNTLTIEDYEGLNITDVFDNLFCYDVASTDVFEVLESTDPACFCYADAGTFANEIAPLYCENELINVQTNGFYEEPNFLQQYVLTDEDGIITQANTTGEFTPDANTYIAYAINTGDNFDVVQNSIGTPLDVILSFPTCYDIIATEPITIISCEPFGYNSLDYFVDDTNDTYVVIFNIEGGEPTGYTSQDGTFSDNVFTSNSIDCEDDVTITIEAPLIEPLIVEVTSPCMPTSINSIDISTHLTIHPIPTTNQLNISFTPINSKDIMIQVFDLMGRVIWEETAQTYNNLYKNTLNIQHWNTGLYLLKIKQGDHTITKRFVKE